MNSVDFCYWLQGFFEITNTTSVSDRQVEIIKNHLNLVFKHEIDPMREQETTTSSQVLNETHQGNLAKETTQVQVPPGAPNVFFNTNDKLVRC